MTSARNVVRRSARPLIQRILARRIALALRDGEAPLPGPLIVSGLLSEAKGISQGARLSLVALRAARFAPLVHDLRPLFDRADKPSRGLPADETGGVWLLHVNAPEAVHALARLPSDTWRRRYRIAYWAYELPRVPDEWVRAAEAFHEIWAPSTFVADALRESGVRTPVRLMPHPVALGPPSAPSPRQALGIPADAFAVLALGDLYSSATRKNLLGAIRIFAEAFPSPGAARLIVKVRGDAMHPAFLSHARHAARGRPDIQFVTGDLTAQEMRGLIVASNLVFSPHRSEGFGLTLAEALHSGVPVLATGWSGNLDFMDGLPEMTIDYSLVPVRDAYRVYRARGQRWAEPDAEDAVAKLRMLAGSADLRSSLAARGRTAIEALSASWSRDALLAMPFSAFVRDAAAGPVAAVQPSR